MELLNIKELSIKYKMPLGGLRGLLFNRNENGMVRMGVIIKLGRRVFIDEEAFQKWLLTHKEGIQNTNNGGKNE